MIKQWIAVLAVAVAQPIFATESDWAYWRERAAERRYEHSLRRQELAQARADRRYDRAMRRMERAQERRAYRTERRAWRGYRERIY